MKPFGVGIDVVEIARFRGVLRKKKTRFLERNFSDAERTYCSSYSDAATHFAGTFAAKEAVVKALGGSAAIEQIEIRRQKNGKPDVWLRGRRSKSVFISISHEKSLACAIAIRT